VVAGLERDDHGRALGERARVRERRDLGVVHACALVVTPSDHAPVAHDHGAHVRIGARPTFACEIEREPHRGDVVDGAHGRSFTNALSSSRNSRALLKSRYTLAKRTYATS